ncbi:MAG: hypothetical protein ABW007_19405 [Chitinophagaceae bacterium]
MSAKTPSHKSNKAFIVWTFKGTQFIAVPTLENGGSFHIADENGKNYGGWMTVEDFRERQKKSPASCEAIGNVIIRVAPRY